MKQFIIIFFAVLISGCTLPVYTPPVDPFEENNPTYLESVSAISREVDRVTIRALPYVSRTDAENQELMESRQRLDRLKDQTHIPSITLIGKLLSVPFSQFIKSRGSSGKDKKFWEGYAKDENFRLNKMRRELENNYKIGLDLLNQAAQYGYAEALKQLMQYKIKVPAVTLKTPKTIEAEQEYQNALVAHESNQRMFNDIGKVVGATLAIAAVAGAAALASKGGGTTPNHRYGAAGPDLSGCCSFHNGVQRDIFNNPLCYTYLDRIACNDGKPSPNCTCSELQ